MGAGVIKSGGGGGGRRRRRSGRGSSAVMSEINVTPFVDVMLVLLIIFMVAAPLLTVGVPVELPETSAAALPTEQEEPLTITLTEDGRLLLQTSDVARDGLITQLRAIAAERESQRVFLRADSAVPYGDVAQIMGALQAGGFSEISFVHDTGGPALNGTDG
ncbi:protein TolR [Halocynthiibacter styelae]|uniref:Protein TolR n=1 Tax=Halocynthiibacter styelae TaxID=2761955 RepID=A0A8J7ICD4_9RHOB|nr:protein TolR [Paenihalocynthiibacter styelae]MBI1492629.1 protein TolR [Paenihalocynthiibacter styelae]